jgi:hypothetical protein
MLDRMWRLVRDLVNSSSAQPIFWPDLWNNGVKCLLDLVVHFRPLTTIPFAWRALHSPVQNRL